MSTSVNKFRSLIPQSSLDSLALSWLQEDTPAFDVGGFVVGSKSVSATLYQKANGVLSGVPFFDAVFKAVNCSVEWHLKEGHYTELKCGDKVKVATVRGRACDLLLGERPALNMLARSSGISTKCEKLNQIKVKHGWCGIIAGTRKTTPGFRLVEKYAMLVNGIDSHRMDLSSMVMLKDNHIWALGSITKAVESARQACGFSVKIEVECQSLNEAEEAILAGADIVMLDNFIGSKLRDTAKILKSKYSHCLIEASGGLTEENCHEYFCSDVDILSFGCVSQSVPHIDYSLKINVE